MNELLWVSLFAFAVVTYKFIKAIAIQGAPKSNKVFAWCLYGISVAALIAVNIFTAGG